MLLGAFEILMTRTAQKTSDIVKLLTILTVTLLPSTLIAGIFGMNFHPSFFDRPSLFWAALNLMVLTMTITLFTIRLALLAATGSTSGIRTWLRRHPTERVRADPHKDASAHRRPAGRKWGVGSACGSPLTPAVPPSCRAPAACDAPKDT